MSPSSLLAAQTAAYAPTFPAPIMLIFGRRITSFRVGEGVDYGETNAVLQSDRRFSRRDMLSSRRDAQAEWRPYRRGSFGRSEARSHGERRSGPCAHFA